MDRAGYGSDPAVGSTLRAAEEPTIESTWAGAEETAPFAERPAAASAVLRRVPVWMLASDTLVMERPASPPRRRLPPPRPRPAKATWCRGPRPDAADGAPPEAS